MAVSRCGRRPNTAARSGRNRTCANSPSVPRCSHPMPSADRTVLRGPSAPTTKRARTRPPPAQLGAHAVGRRTQAGEGGAEPDLAAEAPDLASEHRLDVVLRAQRRERRADAERLPDPRVGERLDLVRLLGQRAGDRDRRFAVDAAGPDRVADPPEAEDLHRAGADAGRARECRGAGAPLDDEDACAVAQRGHGRRETGRSGADDEYVGGVHATQRLRPPGRGDRYRLPTLRRRAPRRADQVPGAMKNSSAMLSGSRKDTPLP